MHVSPPDRVRLEPEHLITCRRGFYKPPRAWRRAREAASNHALEVNAEPRSRRAAEAEESSATRSIVSFQWLKSSWFNPLCASASSRLCVRPIGQSRRFVGCASVVECGTQSRFGMGSLRRPMAHENAQPRQSRTAHPKRHCVAHSKTGHSEPLRSTFAR